MAVASFQDLCTGFCELVQVTPPPLQIDERGLVAFHVVLRGVTINLVHRPQVSPDHVFVLFELGALSQDEATSDAQLHALLDANFVLLEVNPPVFSRNPATGEAVLQYVYPLFEATPNDLYGLIHKEIDRISDWRLGNQPATDTPPLASFHQIA